LRQFSPNCGRNNQRATIGFAGGHALPYCNAAIARKISHLYKKNGKHATTNLLHPYDHLHEMLCPREFAVFPTNFLDRVFPPIV
jgi:hypothetical protein